MQIIVSSGSFFPNGHKSESAVAVEFDLDEFETSRDNLRRAYTTLDVVGHLENEWAADQMLSRTEEERKKMGFEGTSEDIMEAATQYRENAQNAAIRFLS